MCAERVFRRAASLATGGVLQQLRPLRHRANALAIAASLGASLTEVAATASLYYLFYGLMQPAWRMLSDRLGRVRVMRLTLFGATFAGILSSLAPTLTVLIVARAFAGGLFAAVIPASLVYIGDTVEQM